MITQEIYKIQFFLLARVQGAQHINLNNVELCNQFQKYFKLFVFNFFKWSQLKNNENSLLRRKNANKLWKS